MHQTVSLSIIIPCYNEQYRLWGTIEELVSSLEKLDITCEIILVNDGSLDHTHQKMKEIALRYPVVKIISYPKNQ